MNEEEIKQLIQSEIASQQDSDLYSVGKVPFHVHNGLDSPVLGQIAGYSYGLSARTPTHGANVVIEASQGAPSSNGGNVNITAGSGGAVIGPGGALIAAAGSGVAGNSLGGDAELAAGNGHGSSAGGNAFLVSGNGGATGNPGAIEIQQGTGSAQGGALILLDASGNVNINGSTASAGNTDGGDIILTPGAAHGSGVAGSVIVSAAWVTSSQSYSPTAAGTATLDLALSNEHRIQMPAGNITIALSNDTSSEKFIISITQDSVGSRTVTWFTTIRWAGGGAPTLTTTANKRDTFGFIRTGTGTYDGFIVGQNI